MRARASRSDGRRTRGRAGDEPRPPSLHRETRDALETLGLRPSRRRGQNFLVDRSIVAKILSAAAVEGAGVLEIGPGLGTLSDALAERARRLVLVEIDRTMAGRLQDRFAERDNVEVVEADALEIDLAGFFGEGDRAVVVANLPYSVGSQILLRLLEQGRTFARLVVMLQLEVAARLGAAPGSKDYGRLSVWTALRGEAKTLFRVPPGAFVPRPKVDSAVVRIVLDAEPRVPIADPELFRRIVQAGFGQRRKTLRRALSAVLSPEAFDRAAIDPARRCETLSVDELARLANAARCGP